MLTLKQQVVLALARAYYDREQYVQYDQRSMDRVLELTPRRRKRLPPESANSQYIQFLDCSGFTSAVYLQAFGYDLPADLTWHMVDLLERRVYYYERTYEETPEQLDAIEKEVRELLQPGDLITYQRQVGSGHIVMYIGDNLYIDCTNPSGTPNSYNYTDNKNNIYDVHGGIWIRSLDRAFQREVEGQPPVRNLFHSSCTRFSVSRPLDVVGDPLPQALVRLKEARGLWCAVENSAPGCREAYPGGTVDYTVIVRNMYQPDKDITVTFAPPAGTKLQGEGKVEWNLAAGKEERLTFTVTVDEDNTAPWLESPAVTVNGLEVFAHPVLLGRKLPEAKMTQVLTDAKAAMAEGATAVEAASKAYGAQGIAMDPQEWHYANSHFFFHDSTNGDVLSRRPQKPFKDLAVYAAFGGRAVITPEMGSADGIRTTHITRSDLLPGDVLLCLGDGFGKSAFSSIFDGETLTGRFETGGETKTLTAEEADRFIDSLFGQHSFLLLRPSLGL